VNSGQALDARAAGLGANRQHVAGRAPVDHATFVIDGRRRIVLGVVNVQALRAGGAANDQILLLV
jgi:hypothetical protein